MKKPELAKRATAELVRRTRSRPSFLFLVSFASNVMGHVWFGYAAGIDSVGGGYARATLLTSSLGYARGSGLAPRIFGPKAPLRAQP